MNDQIVSLLATASFTLSAYGILFCFTQTKNKLAMRSLGLIMVCSSMIEVDFVIWDADASLQLEVLTEVSWFIAMTLVAPLSWNYICVLTSPYPKVPKNLWLHCLLPSYALFLAILIAAMSSDARLGLFFDAFERPSGWPAELGRLGEILVILTVLQWTTYLYATIRRLLNYRTDLHLYVAKTEDRELRWVWSVLFILTFLWVVSFVDVLLGLFGGEELMAEWLGAVLSLTVILVLLLWGTRQRPGIAPNVPTQSNSARYDKSALSLEMAERIAAKLRNVMQTEHLYRDPDLSLWSLSKAISTIPNYVSQTLSQNMGQSFFDFVNGCRVEEAKKLLVDTDQTVLSIAFDVGFNSRSAFYSAFKRNSGQTPSDFRSVKRKTD